MKYQLLLHGFLTFLIGNLAGIGYSKAIRKRIKNEAGWKLMYSTLLYLIASMFAFAYTTTFCYLIVGRLL